jgi:hypothetical protein
VQLVALSKETVDQLDVINRSHGTADDQQRASSVLIAQLMVTTGLTALSVQGARNLRMPHGPPLELIEQNGVKMLRVLGEDTSALAGESKTAPGVTHQPPLESRPAPGVTHQPPVESKTTPGVTHEQPIESKTGATHEPPVDSKIGAGVTQEPAAEAKTTANDMRWQMEHKNQKLVKDGEAPRFSDLDAAVKEGMDSLAKANARGYPYGFKDKATFESFGKALREGVAGRSAPSGGIPVPTENAAVQGSAVYRGSPNDIDVALLVDQKQFDKLIEQSFSNQVTKVRARGIDPLRMTISDAETAKERTLANAVQTGIIRRDDLVPRLSGVRDNLEVVAGSKVDLSVVRRGGQFDRGPYFPIP